MRMLKYELPEEEMTNENCFEISAEQRPCEPEKKNDNELQKRYLRTLLREHGACRDISYKTTWFFLTDSWLASPSHSSAQRGHQLHDTVVELEDYPLHSKDFRITSSFI